MQLVACCGGLLHRSHLRVICGTVAALTAARFGYSRESQAIAGEW